MVVAVALATVVVVVAAERITYHVGEIHRVPGCNGALAALDVATVLTADA